MKPYVTQILKATPTKQTNNSKTLKGTTKVPTKITDTHIRFHKVIDSPNNTLNSKFQIRFLHTPCQACGSSKHPLLSLKPNVVNNNDIRYQYQCHVIEPSPIYPKYNKSLNITYLLSSRTYAEYYKYDINIATNKNILKTSQSNREHPEFHVTFMDDVMRICLEHQNNRKDNHKQTSNVQSPVNNPSYRIPKKRKREHIVNTLPQNLCKTHIMTTRILAKTGPIDTSRKNKNKHK